MVGIREFHLDYCDLRTMIENVDVLLRTVNVKINKNNDKRKCHIIPMIILANKTPLRKIRLNKSICLSNVPT